MPNAKDHKAGNGKILAVGTTGAGKTSGFLSLPGKKFIYIFDPNALETLRGHDIDYEIFIPIQLNLNAVPLKAGLADTHTKTPEPTTYVEFEKDFEEKLSSGFFDDYDVVALDSMTTFSDLVMDRIMHLNGRFGKWPEQADWTATMNTINNVIRTFVNINATVYLTAHIEFKQEEATSKMINQLSLIGRLRNKLPLLFSEVWQFYADVDKDNKTHYYIQTQQDRYSPYLRSTLKHLNRIEDVTIEDWANPTQSGIGKLLTPVS